MVNHKLGGYLVGSLALFLLVETVDFPLDPHKGKHFLQ